MLPLFCRLRIEGVEHPPRTGGYLLTCNHTPGHDYVMLAYATPRQVYYMAKTEIFSWHPLLSKFLATVGTFPIKRGTGDREALMAAVDIVRSGRVLGMFPEGTRSRNNQLRRGKSGAARIAMLAAAPVVPAVVINAQGLTKDWPWRWPRPEITVRFGPPLQLT